MKVRELKEILDNQDDETVVFISYPCAHSGPNIVDRVLWVSLETNKKFNGEEFNYQLILHNT